jgi:tetratricopeptide (TPR) repeat protein
MNSTTTSSPNRPMSEILSENNIQGTVTKNKAAIFTVVGVIIAAIVAFGVFKSFSDKSKTEYNSKIYAFETTVLKDYLANPTAPNAAQNLEKAVGALNLQMGDYLGLLPVVIKSSDALASHGQYAEARSLLAMGAKIASDDYARYFIYSRQAVVFEDMGEDKLAIETLEKMTSQSVKIFEGKTYLDLGRLYLKTGNKEKAKANFTRVVEKVKDEAEFVKIAQLYLAKM